MNLITFPDSGNTYCFQNKIPTYLIQNFNRESIKNW